MGMDVEFATLVKDASKPVGADFIEAQSLFVKSINEPKRQITALASTGDLDRHEEIILPEAFKERLPVYMKNPVVIASHLHRLQTGHSSVVGNAIKVWIDKKGLWVVIEFVEGTALGDEYWLLYSQKIQRALSVGFVSLESNHEERDGIRVLVHTKVELLEISCVPVPANPEALSRSKQRKADFVSAKKEDKELQKLEAEMKASGELSDEAADEFAKEILGIDQKGYNFDELAKGETKTGFAALVGS